MSSMNCPSCHTLLGATATECPNCGGKRTMTRLHRGSPDRMLAGVCAALSERYGFDLTLMRALLVLLTLMSVGQVFWAYVAVWCVTPPTAKGVAPISRLFDAISGIFGGNRQAVERRPSAF